MVSKKEYDSKTFSNIKVDIGEAIFHQFGCDYEEFDNGAGNYSTAIIEWKDGTVKNVPVELIRFIDKKGRDDEKV